MKITVNRKSLTEALSIVSVAAPSKLAYANGGGVFIEARGPDRLMLCADSGAIRAENEIKCSILSEGKVYISLCKLSALLNRDCETVDLELSGEKLLVNSGTLSATIPVWYDATFPTRRKDGDKISWVVFDSNVSDIITLACSVTGDGKTHIWNEGVSIADDGIKLTIAGADGRQFFRAELESSENVFSIVLPGKLLRSFMGYMAQDTGFTMQIHDKHAYFTCCQAIFCISAMDVKYGAVGPIADQMDAECKQSIIIDRLKIIQGCQMAAATLDPNDDNRVGISIAKNSVRISARATSGGDTKEDIECKSDAVMEERGVNPGYVTGFLRQLDCDVVKLAFVEGRPGIRISPEVDNGQRFYVATMK